jgi:hypothetical protein
MKDQILEKKITLDVVWEELGRSASQEFVLGANVCR